MGERNQNSVFVGNLPNDADNEELSTIFQQFGTVNSVRIMDGKAGGKIAFVNFVEDESAAAALAKKRHVYKDASIVVKQAIKRRDGLKNSPGDQGQGEIRTNKNKSNTNINKNRPDLVSTIPVKQQSPCTSSANVNAANTSGWKQNVDLQPGDMVTIIATHVESPTVFFGQIKDRARQQDALKMLQILASLCNSWEPFTGVPEVDKVYAAKFSQDGNWYRCKVTALKDENQCEVQYIDYGNKEVVQNAELRVLPPKQVTKPHAIRCSLFGFRSVYNSGTIGFLRGVEKLGSLILEKEITAHVAHTYDPGAQKFLLPLEVECEENDIGTEMLEAGFVSRMSDIPSKCLTSLPGPNKTDMSDSRGLEPVSVCKKGQFKKRTSEASIKTCHSMSNNHTSFETNSRSGFQCHSAPAIDIWEPSKTAAPLVSPQGLAAMSQGTQDNIVKLQAELGYLKSELLKYQRRCNELRRVEARENETLLRCEQIKADCETLKMKLATAAKQMEENTLSERLKNLLVGVSKVKHLRLQFPSDFQVRDNIQWAGELLTNSESCISLDNLQIKNRLDQLKKDYESAQDKIKACTVPSELDDLVRSRDDSGRALLEVLLEFNKTIQHMPIDMRRQSLQAVLSALRETHGNFLKFDVAENLTLTEAVDEYAKWKTEKLAEFREKRLQTDSCYNLLNKSLNLIQQELALCGPEPGSSSTAAANFDKQLNKYTVAIYDEIKATDMENCVDSPFLAMILKILMKESANELANIDQLFSEQNEAQRLAEQLSKWSESRPDTAPLLSVRKTIKSLKSKIRHKLADKQDLEESDDLDLEELKRLSDEVNSLREELQQAFSEEDDCLALLAQLSSSHFPELPIQYPETGIRTVMEYGDLVKSGRLLEYFNVQPLQGADKPSVMKSTYCKRPVVIKEYIVDDSVGLQRSEFLNQVTSYNRIQHASLVPLEAVFTVKDKRNIYIQLPFYENKLAEMACTSTRSNKKLQFILDGLLKGLNVLHEAGFIHGAVHPNNVFISPDNLGVLAEFDFSKTALQRAQRQYTTSNGLTFLPPEVSTSAVISKASDVYNFGLLVLWLVSVRSNTAPSLDNISTEDPSLIDIIKATVCDDPKRRPTTAQLLSFPYFVNILEDEKARASADSTQVATSEPESRHSLASACDQTNADVIKDDYLSCDLLSLRGLMLQELNKTFSDEAALRDGLSSQTEEMRHGVESAALADGDINTILTSAKQGDGDDPDIGRMAHAKEADGLVIPVQMSSSKGRMVDVIDLEAEEGLGFSRKCEADIVVWPLQWASGNIDPNRSSLTSDTILSPSDSLVSVLPAASGRTLATSKDCNKGNVNNSADDTSTTLSD